MLFSHSTGVAARPPVFSVLLISASALAYEVLLMRLFAIIQWHHFAYMIISLALLGYGVSGTFVTLARNWLLPRYPLAYSVNALLFALSTTGCFLLTQQLPFNALEILWDPAQWGYLLTAYLLLLLPFFFAANCIVLTFSAFQREIPRIYGFDLFGAGIGSLLLVAALFFLYPQTVLLAVSLVALSAVFVAAVEMGFRYRTALFAVTIAVTIAALFLPDRWLSLNVSPYKPLSQSLQVSGSSTVDSRSSPHGVITVVENQRIPFRLAEGVSLNNLVEPPEQLAVFIDSDAPGAITRYDGDLSKFAYLDYQTSALPYHLGKKEKVLVVGMGGGSGILQAAYNAAGHIETVELNAQLAGLVQHTYADFSGWPLLAESTQVHVAEARAFLTHNERRYDLIQMSLLDAAGASGAGLYALSENYLYTREAFETYYARLAPGGMLSVTRWTKVPPRDALKLFATAIDALRGMGISQPGNQLALIRGWNTSTLIMKRGPFTPADIASLEAFCKKRSFDSAWYPGITRKQVNRYNVLDQPYFYIGAQALLGDASEAFISDYKFSITPATDDRPYYFNFFKWDSLGEIFALQQQAGFSLIELGYPVLVVTLFQALAVSILLVLLPLWFVPRDNHSPQRGYVGAVMLYFLLIGLAYLFIEIAFIQRFILFLADPVFAVAAVLSGFLLFSGLGSFTATRLLKTWKKNPVVIVIAGIAAIAVISLWLQPLLFSSLSTLPILIKVLVSLATIAPLAFLMGMPLPLALPAIADRATWLMPWAWGVNGFASLMSAILATLLAVHFGFKFVLVMATLLYISAALVHHAWLFKK